MLYVILLNAYGKLYIIKGFEIHKIFVVVKTITYIYVGLSMNLKLVWKVLRFFQIFCMESHMEIETVHV